RRSRFGNLLLSRRRVIQIFHHLLPRPPHGGVKHMPRQAIEAVVATAGGAVRVVTTHLEYHSSPQRLAQVARLRELHAEVWGNLRAPPVAEEDGPYAARARPAAVVICGDFNMTPGDPAYQAMIAPFADDTPGFLDAWRVVHGDRAHAPTCGVFDHVQWPAGPHCRDYFFVSAPLAGRVRALDVDVETDASDHQPIRLILDEE
ncbi:MAG: hypothetical protein D6826_10525, partial [Alphaproteobacteria bacterium]